MYVRMLRIQVPHDKMDAFVEMWRTQMLPFAQRQKGWQGAHLLVDRKAGQTVSSPGSRFLSA